MAEPEKPHAQTSSGLDFSFIVTCLVIALGFTGIVLLIFYAAGGTAERGGAAVAATSVFLAALATKLIEWIEARKGKLQSVALNISDTPRLGFVVMLLVFLGIEWAALLIRDVLSSIFRIGPVYIVSYWSLVRDWQFWATVVLPTAAANAVSGYLVTKAFKLPEITVVAVCSLGITFFESFAHLLVFIAERLRERRVESYPDIFYIYLMFALVYVGCALLGAHLSRRWKRGVAVLPGTGQAPRTGP